MVHPTSPPSQGDGVAAQGFHQNQQRSDKTAFGSHVGSSLTNDAKRDLALREMMVELKITPPIDDERSPTSTTDMDRRGSNMFESSRFNSLSARQYERRSSDELLKLQLPESRDSPWQKTMRAASERNLSVISEPTSSHVGSALSVHTGTGSLPNSPKAPKGISKKISRRKASLHTFTNNMFGPRRSTTIDASFTEEQSEDGEDGKIENIGLKLALPEAMDIMTGKAPPPSPARPSSKRKHEQVERKRAKSLPRSGGKEDGTPETPTLSCLSDDTVLTTNKRSSIGSLTGTANSSAEGSAVVSSAISNANEIVLRTCEMSPADHQVSLPAADDFLMHARICALMESYANITVPAKQKQVKFDFGTLTGRSRIELEGMYTQLTGIKRTTTFGQMGFGNNSKVSNLSSTAAAKTAEESTCEPHPSILKSLLECADDLVVEGYFMGCHTDESVSSSTKNIASDAEVTIFSSQRYRQFIVCYRGPTEQQGKPVSRRKSKTLQQGGDRVLHPDHPVNVYKEFRDQYFVSDMENKVFDVLNRLAAESPFCDVVTTGHSFGAALAVIGAVRYAALFPMMAVSCHAFGSPKVGGADFRQLAHSLPNLKIMRMENGEDPYVTLPEGIKWLNVGHTIKLINNDWGTTTASSQQSSGGPATKVTATAYRFDNKRPQQSSFWTSPIVTKTKKMRRDHEIRSYVSCIEEFTHHGVPWVGGFVGEEGKGIVSGVDFEARGVV